MSLLRSARFPAVMLLCAAAVGLILANSPLGPGLGELRGTHLAIEGSAFDLSVGHWISDGLLAIFFFTAAIELRYELTKGALREPRKAMVPAIAAAGGVIVPILVYLFFTNGTQYASGWPIPTATDIAFALGVLAVFGRGLPGAVRAFLLALAILDDIVGIIFIAVLFTSDLNPLWLAVAAGLVLVFFVLSRVQPRTTTDAALRQAALLIIGIATWGVVYQSGVHATIAGVALGFAMAPKKADRLRHRLEPWVNALVLPIFAFSSAAVMIPAVSVGELSPAFWGILVALPVGKIIGIALAGFIAQKALGTQSDSHLAVGDLIAAGALGGIGFTVSLLLGELAFAGNAVIGAEVTLAVLAGSIISMVLAGILVTWRARHYRKVAAVDS
ncbi:Na+/H+ antiporter NhaA [Microbacterium sp. NC79]|uniref:Na+/H+ antiporter NhaA n=1 Tax=Microbacterium sp. NC79 TaxID=2851009 RepID=UPI001C2C9F07|nr:Na+/H+ antiporter NhaA [Microbacterium sp. NC79]